MKKLFFIFILFFATSEFLHAQTNHKGKILELIQVENYTYVRINENSKDVWIAIPKIDAKVGDTIETSSGIIMTDFKSSTLKRTFPEIIFATKASIIESNDGKKTTTSDIVPGTFNIAKIIENSKELSGKTIKFKGKVTKVSPNILGKNWAHFTDPNNEKNDLVVTTKEILKTGDTITMQGTVETNKDLGAGYFFSVIIEDAKIVK